MHYEIHLTVEASQYAGKEFWNNFQFKQDCELIGAKPILIETENGEIVGNQMMTSYTGNLADYKGDLERQKNLLTRLGWDVLREKVEIKPEMDWHPKHIYYEAHLKLRIHKGDYNAYREGLLKPFCEKNNLHLSQNLLKNHETDYMLQFLTYRSKELISVYYFKSEIYRMCSELFAFRVDVCKVEFEECILDTNLSIDHNWLTKTK